MHNILTIIFLFLSITNFCSGQIESNISLGIDEFLLKKTNDLYEKNICLVTNSGAINKDGLTSVEILNEEFDIQIVFNSHRTAFSTVASLFDPTKGSFCYCYSRSVNGNTSCF